MPELPDKEQGAGLPLQGLLIDAAHPPMQARYIPEKHALKCVCRKR